MGDKKFNCISLYSGCSGSDLGFSEEFNIKLAIERDPKCCDTYEANFGYRPICMPVARCTEIISHAEVVIGGPPCQSFSNARTGGYEGGYKSLEGLEEIKNYAHVLNLSVPDLFVMENAPTLIEQPSMFKVLAEIVKILNVGERYDIFIYLLNAEDYGVPQQRKRTFILGSRRGLGVGFHAPVGEHWSKKYSGWADYLGVKQVSNDLPLLVRRGNVLKGKLPTEVAYTVIGADLPNIRYSQTKSVGTLTRIERAGVAQEPLTIKQLAKLQGFPDDYVWPDRSAARVQIGNAWCVPVARALAKEAKRVLEVIHGR